MRYQIYRSVLLSSHHKADQAVQSSSPTVKDERRTRRDKASSSGNCVL